jgi:hypothetical protein
MSLGVLGIPVEQFLNRGRALKNPSDAVLHSGPP